MALDNLCVAGLAEYGWSFHAKSAGTPLKACYQSSFQNANMSLHRRIRPPLRNIKITEQSENVYENKRSMLEKGFFMPSASGHFGRPPVGPFLRTPISHSTGDSAIGCEIRFTEQSENVYENKGAMLEMRSFNPTPSPPDPSSKGGMGTD